MGTLGHTRMGTRMGVDEDPRVEVASPESRVGT